MRAPSSLARHAQAHVAQLPRAAATSHHPCFALLVRLAACSRHTTCIALRRDQAAVRKVASKSDAGAPRAAAPTAKKEPSQWPNGSQKKAWWAGGGRQEARSVLELALEYRLGHIHSAFSGSRALSVHCGDFEA